jgi:hypothetical protein
MKRALRLIWRYLNFIGGAALLIYIWLFSSGPTLWEKTVTSLLIAFVVKNSRDIARNSVDIEWVKKALRGVKEGLRDVKEDLRGIKEGLESVKGGLQGVKGDLRGVKEKISSMAADMEWIKRRLREE